MSRRRGEFEHRTSIFEGAFRAWSHLGGLEPEDLETKPASELDPLNAPILNDHRLLQGKKGKDDSGTPTLNPDGSKRREYPYEPLPRSGLAHPYVQAILSPWLGPDADNDAIQLGLTTLRTWWQHRRKGESGSAIAALGTEKMKGVVEGYTRHFFTLAHCLIMNDKEQPPRSLHSKMKEAEKMKNKKNKKRGQDEDPAKLALFGGLGAASNNPAAVSAGIAADLTNQNLSPLERLHVAQQRQLAVEGGVSNNMAGGQVQTINPLDPSNPIIPIKNKCVPGKPDLPAIVDAVNHHAAQLTHSGSSKIMDKSGSAGATPAAVPSTGLSIPRNDDSDAVPVVFVTGRGEVLLSMAVDGITCAHCVKIVETVLKGCNGNKSPIDGLLDAAADRALCSILIKIDRVSNAKRIAFEASRNLAMVGYSAKAKDMSPTAERNGKSEKLTAEQMAIAFEQVGRAHPLNIFNWTSPCSCPDNGVLREDCAR
jgi:copper chaperone CopZ